MLSGGGAGSADAPATVPLTRLDFHDPELLEELIGAVREVAERGAFTLGEPVEAFERELAEWCEAGFAVGVSSGTSALELALRALAIGPGDEVIVPANSFIATAEAVSATGATPRLVDVDPDSHLIDAEVVADSLTPRVRCVIPVHLFGATVDMDPILTLAAEAGIHVVEDACQAHGARYRGRRVGTLGDVGCLSFYPTKNLGAWGDAGAVLTSSQDLADRVRLLRAHGERPRYRHRLVGATARLDALQAAILRRKLPRLEGCNDRRRLLGAQLRQRLQEIGGNIDLPAPPPQDGDHVYHLFVVRSDMRDLLRAHLESSAVASAVHYPVPIHLSEAYSHLEMPAGSLPVCESLAERMCTLPLFPGMSDGELDRVAGAVTGFAQAQASSRR